MKTKQLALNALKSVMSRLIDRNEQDESAIEARAAIAALEADIARVVEPVAEIIKFSDTSTASAIEKTRRYLTKMADKRQGNNYFFDDGFPREVIADDAAAALAVFEQLAAPQAVNAELAGYTGMSDEVDFSTDRWTFLMAPGYRVSTGQYLITKIKKATS